MSELRINTLRLRNFKGIRDFTFDIGGQDADVFAENARGKSTLKDACQWLLFGKNSADKKEFSIKTLDENNKPLHGLEHEVEGLFSLDGKQIKLGKIYKEKWTQKRGSSHKDFTGHTTDHFVDDIPVSEKEYKEAVAAICDEQVFRLLTDLTYFNSVMKWETRRALLLEVCGDVCDQDVIDSDIALDGLPDILGGRTQEQHRKAIAARKTKINEELKSLPARIDECQRNLPETSGTTEAVESDLLKIRTAIQEKHQERARLDSGGEVAEKKRQLAEARAALQTIENKARDAADGERREAQRAASDIDLKIDSLTRNVQACDITISDNSETIKRLEGNMERLRDDWQIVNAETFSPEEDSECVTCGAAPEHQKHKASDKALAGFNKSKAERLERIDAEGKQVKARAGGLSLDNEGLRSQIKEIEAERDKLADERSAIQIPEPGAAATVDPTDGEGERLLHEIAALEDEITKLGEGNTDALTAITAEIADMQQQIKDGEARLAAFKQVVQGKERIEELKDQEKVLGAEYEQLEKELNLCETFIKTKVGMLTDRINSKFKLARFQLFETQINEGVKEKCETLVNGVPYADLNTGARIRVGLDIIDTLSAHYDFIPFVFVDNAEAITDPIAAPGQLIRLIASPKDKALRIETNNTALKEAI